MRYSLLFASVLFAAGCGNVETDVSLDVSTSETESTPSPEVMTTSFEAGDSATLAVPEMSCAIMCYPKVKETLEGLEGIEAVELVEQKEEAVIDDRRVVVKFAGEVSSDMAVAALEEAGFPESKFE